MVQDCLVLETDNRTTILPIWPDPTSWNADREQLEFVGPTGTQMNLRLGDRLIPGGVTRQLPGPYRSRIPNQCPEIEMFVVSDVELPR